MFIYLIYKAIEASMDNYAIYPTPYNIFVGITAFNLLLIAFVIFFQPELPPETKYEMNDSAEDTPVKTHAEKPRLVIRIKKPAPVDYETVNLYGKTILPNKELQDDIWYTQNITDHPRRRLYRNKHESDYVRRAFYMNNWNPITVHEVVTRVKEIMANEMNADARTAGRKAEWHIRRMGKLGALRLVRTH